MTPTDYVVPAERVVAVLKANLCGHAGEEPYRHAPMSRSRLLDALKIKKPREQRRFAQQLQHMSHKCYAAYRISFQYYPTGWIYDPPEVPSSVPRSAHLVRELNADLRFINDELATKLKTLVTPDPIVVAAVDVADIKIVCEWASRQWVSGPAHNAFKRLREAAK